MGLEDGAACRIRGTGDELPQRVMREEHRPAPSHREDRGAQPLELHARDLQGADRVLIAQLLQLADELAEGDVGQAEPLGDPAAEAQPVVPVAGVACRHGQLRSRRDLERGHGARTSKRHRRLPLPRLVWLALVEDEPEHNAMLLSARTRVEDLLHHGEEAHRAPHLPHADDHIGLSHADSQRDHLGAQRGVHVGLQFLRGDVGSAP